MEGARTSVNGTHLLVFVLTECTSLTKTDGTHLLGYVLTDVHR